MNKGTGKNAAQRLIGFLTSGPGSFAVVVILLILLIWQVADFTRTKSLNSLSRSGSLRVDFYATSLRDTLEKYRHLPYVLSRNAKILDLLQNNVPPVRVNPHLEDFAHASGALIYVLDKGGTTVATSNWRTKKSLLGRNYSFRPYFIDASSGRSGGYYAVGLRTGQPGFFLSYPVKHRGEFLGAIVVKVDLEPMQEAWKKSGEAVIVSDAFGVIFLTSKKEWKYSSLRKLPEHTASRLRALQYLDLPLAALSLEREMEGGHNILNLNHTRYLEEATPLPEYGWRIHYLTDLKVVENNTRLAIGAAAIISFLFLLTLLFLRERRQKLISRQEAKRARAVGEVNERLRLEIDKHRETEAHLRKTQRDLVQAGKLAALGRMSAAIAHELNQPVTAIKTFLASSRLLLQRNQPDKVRENLDFIADLTERMGKITGQLKTFARKSKKREERIQLIRLIEKVVQYLQPQVKEAGASLSLEIPGNLDVTVAGDSLQLEQVLSNLLHNALDAVREAERREIYLSVRTIAGKVQLTCADSGAGIAGEALDSLFDPFFTTKEIGKGLGLGLSIAYGIIQDLGGSINARNSMTGGAEFVVELPVIPDEDKND